jgi:hypothetical protein
MGNGKVTMIFKCVELEQSIVDDILSLGPVQTPIYINRQYGRFIDTSPLIVESLSKLFQNRDFEGFYAELHKFAGFAATLGSDQIKKKCHDISLAPKEDIEAELGQLGIVVERANQEMARLLLVCRKKYS